MHTDAVPTANVTQTFRVLGMTCHHCEMAVTAELSRLPGVRRVSIDLPAGTVVTESDQPLDRGDVAAAIDEAGYALA